MKHTPDVSLIIPTKNCRDTIVDLINSLRKIDYPNYEAVIVDSSDDGTDKIASTEGVSVIKTSRLGLNVARNVGVKYTKGEIICFTDGDCLVPTTWIDRIVKEFENNEKVGCVGGSISVLPNGFLGRYSRHSIIQLFPMFFQKRTIMHPKEISRHRLPVGCNMAFKREALERIGFFNEEWNLPWDEFELMYRLLVQGYQVLTSPEIVIQHQPRPSFGELMRQSYNYGMGAGSFSTNHRLNIVSDRFSGTLRRMKDTLPLSIREFFNSHDLSILLYPFLDLFIGLSYFLGYVSGHRKKIKAN